MNLQGAGEFQILDDMMPRRIGLIGRDAQDGIGLMKDLGAGHAVRQILIIQPPGEDAGHGQRQLGTGEDAAWRAQDQGHRIGLGLPKRQAPPGSGRAHVGAVQAAILIAFGETGPTPPIRRDEGHKIARRTAAAFGAQIGIRAFQPRPHGPHRAPRIGSARRQPLMRSGPCREKAGDMGAGRGRWQGFVQDQAIGWMPAPRDLALGHHALTHVGHAQHAQCARHHHGGQPGQRLGRRIHRDLRAAPPRDPDRAGQLAPAAVGVGGHQLDAEQLGNIGQQPALDLREVARRPGGVQKTVGVKLDQRRVEPVEHVPTPEQKRLQIAELACFGVAIVVLAHHLGQFAVEDAAGAGMKQWMAHPGPPSDQRMSMDPAPARWTRVWAFGTTASIAPETEGTTRAVPAANCGTNAKTR